MTRITLSGVTKTYRGRRPVTALDGVDMEIADHALVAVLGASGCGKTTMLRLIAGFERPDAGTITIGDEVVASPGRYVPPERRHVGIVPQEGALFPHLDVSANIRFALHARRGGVADRRVGELLELVGLQGYGKRRPHELSGGQQQRVALARALAPNPAVVLLDEPFTALDVSLRNRLRLDVAQVLHDAGATALMVTHDPEEALVMADHVAVMRSGRIEQFAARREIYLRPANEAVARILGDVVAVAGVADGTTANTAFGPVGLRESAHGPVRVLVRPEQVVLSSDTATKAVVDEVQFNGHDGLVMLTSVPTGPAGDPAIDPADHAAQAVARWSAIALPEVGAIVGVRIDGDALLAVSETSR
ncbi:MAG TPA: ABC transporter ATP-binding protein [Ilumatobacter sp.]|nr:ABC transporter ATP-binding protein [Ilumatobacter sp.]